MLLCYSCTLVAGSRLQTDRGFTALQTTKELKECCKYILQFDMRYEDRELEEQVADDRSHSILFLKGKNVDKKSDHLFLIPRLSRQFRTCRSVNYSTQVLLCRKMKSNTATDEQQSMMKD